jgi:pilus assembly protein CpaB
MIRVIILVVALVSAGLSAWFITRISSSETQAAVSGPQLPTVEILVAAGDIAQGKVVSEADFRWQEWPLASASPSFISRSSRPDAIAAFKGNMVRSKLMAGEPVQEEKLSRTQSGMLASMLTAGKRAVAIRISAESAAGGFVLPNDRVDIVQTMTVAVEGGQQYASKTILRNIRVLAIDQRAADVKDPAFVGKTATLEVDSDQVEMLSAIGSGGTLSLALRSSEDFNLVEMTVKREANEAIRVFHGEKSEKVRVQ